ncbi:hypothetical protein SEA_NECROPHOXINUS_123 [Microbacterium phage Necrophoxinus]|nr:hypothetical protein SEA_NECROPHOXINUS_7 [Microbacterium phage Necrophoxinus]QWS69484.1 hypothetical protein SEA_NECROPHOXINUS_123 [Microbacterium phage Necrophoxinus]
MATVVLDTFAKRRALAVAEVNLSDIRDNITDYLANDGANLASDDYTDLRYAAHNAQDKVDAAFLALANANRYAATAWRNAQPGDIITTYNGECGTLKARGTIAGWMTVPGKDREVRVELAYVESIARD